MRTIATHHHRNGMTTCLWPVNLSSLLNSERERFVKRNALPLRLRICRFLESLLFQTFNISKLYERRNKCRAVRTTHHHRNGMATCFGRFLPVGCQACWTQKERSVRRNAFPLRLRICILLESLLFQTFNISELYKTRNRCRAATPTHHHLKPNGNIGDTSSLQLGRIYRDPAASMPNKASRCPTKLLDVQHSF